MITPRRVVTFIRAVVALATIGVLAVGVPMLLVRLAGWPLPSRVPNADQVRVALGGDIGDQFWLKLFAIVVWLAWAQLMAAIVREVAALARGRLVRVRGADSWAQHVAGRLVGAIALAATVVGPAPGAQSRTLPQAVLEVARSQPEAEPSVTALALPTHVVVRGESLSSIAEAELGDESAWPGIWSANRGRTFGSRVFHDPNLILPGWELRLPHVAPAPPAPAPPAPVAPVLLPPVVITAPSPVPPTPAPTPAATAPAITTPAAPRPAATALAPAPLLGGEVGAAHDLDRASSRDDAPAWARTSGVLGASLLATGIAATLAGRRRRALRAASAATAAPAPDAELAPLVTAVHATSDALRMARLELALRAMAGRLVSARSVARPLAVRAHADGRLEIVVDRDVTLEGPWVRSDAARCWVLPADVPLVALTDDSRGVAPPCPALVGLGADDDAEVYVDLEALPLLDVGSQVAGEELVPLIVTTLATTPLADELRVIVVGAELPGLSGRHSVQTVPDVASAVLEVETLTAGIASVTKGGPATFRLRASAGHEPWEPVVVVLSAAVERGDDLDRLVELAKGHRGVAVIGPELDVASWRLTAQGTSWELEPLGWTLRRYGLTEIEMGKIGDALAQANEPLITEVRTTSEPVCPPPRSRALMVRVLGPVDVVDRAGEPVAFERARSLELVVWLAQHGGNATRAGARSALWGLDISNASFSNVVSEARRAMARLVAPPDGDDWLARTYAERLPLHPAVALDADVVAMHLDRARGMADEAAIEELRAALALVRGAPYAGASYPWADAEALPSTLTLLATTVAAELAERCLAAGDLGAVFAATARGLEVLPGHEELVALRMRAHAARGDLAAVRGEFASYAQAIASDVWAGGDVAPKLLALRKDLLAGPVPVAGS